MAGKGGRKMQRFSKEEDAHLLKLAPKMGVKEVAEEMARRGYSRSEQMVGERLRRLERNGVLKDRLRYRRLWTPEEAADFVMLLPHHDLPDIARMIHRPESSLKRRVHNMGLVPMKVQEREGEMSPSEVAEVLGVCRRSVLRWCEKGWIDPRRIGPHRKTLRIPKSAVYRFVRDYPDKVGQARHPFKAYLEEHRGRPTVGLTATAVANRAGCCASTVRRYIRKGELKGWTEPGEGSAYFIDPLEAQRWVRWYRVTSLTEKRAA